MTEYELVEIYAKALNRLDFELLEPFLDDDVVYESQEVLSSLKGKAAVSEYLRGKFATIRKAIWRSQVYAEIGHCGTQDGNNIQVLSAEPFRPCILMAQGDPSKVLVLVLLDVESAKIKRIDLCTVVPHPSSAIRSGVYPE
ncbi:MAG: nuclear transport factor 2 family protein [Acidobacteria bacterium]|nr:nuclear transport factor 2 family protein [Acidobacteriota bacterium]